MDTAKAKPTAFSLDVGFVYRFSRIFVLAFLVILLALMSPAFLTKTNSINVLR